MINVEVILPSRPLDVWAAFLHDAEVGRAIVDVIRWACGQLLVRVLQQVRDVLTQMDPTGVKSGCYAPAKRLESD